VSLSQEQIGICKISAAGIKQVPSHQAAMVSQVLFGETVKLIRQKDKYWCRIECQWDGIIGWVDPKQFHFITEKDAEGTADCQTFALELIQGAMSNQQVIPITIGANLLNCDGINFKMPFGKFQYSGQIVNLAQSQDSAVLLINIAKRFLHAPYMYGGRSIGGIDADGFIQVIYKLIGINIPRFASEQCQLGKDVGFVAEALPGDIAFFESKKTGINHVGLVLEDQTILHVFGGVRIDSLDQQGIFNRDTRRYNFRLRTIRRLIFK